MHSFKYTIQKTSENNIQNIIGNFYPIENNQGWREVSFYGILVKPNSSKTQIVTHIFNEIRRDGQQKI